MPIFVLRQPRGGNSPNGSVFDRLAPALPEVHEEIVHLLEPFRSSSMDPVCPTM